MPVGIQVNGRWLAERVSQIHEAAGDVDAACKARDSIGLRIAAQDLARASRALMRVCDSRDVFEVDERGGWA